MYKAGEEIEFMNHKSKKWEVGTIKGKNYGFDTKLKKKVEMISTYVVLTKNPYYNGFVIRSGSGLRKKY
jgi:hypothetical protein